jgi:hypothetical protein
MSRFSLLKSISVLFLLLFFSRTVRASFTCAVTLAGVPDGRMVQARAWNPPSGEDLETSERMARAAFASLFPPPVWGEKRLDGKVPDAMDCFELEDEHPTVAALFHHEDRWIVVEGMVMETRPATVPDSLRGTFFDFDAFGREMLLQVRPGETIWVPVTAGLLVRKS